MIAAIIWVFEETPTMTHAFFMMASDWAHPPLSDCHFLGIISSASFRSTQRECLWSQPILYTNFAAISIFMRLWVGILFLWARNAPPLCETFFPLLIHVKVSTMWLVRQPDRATLFGFGFSPSCYTFAYLVFLSVEPWLKVGWTCSLKKECVDTDTTDALGLLITTTKFDAAHQKSWTQLQHDISVK